MTAASNQRPSGRVANRQMRRQLEKVNAQRPVKLTAVPPEMWPAVTGPAEMISAWINQEFLVQVYAEADGVVRLSVNRTRVLPDGHWEERITWDELQAIKAELGFGHHYGIEIYPKDQDVVNVSNIRHLWILPEPLKIGWVNN